MSIQFRCAGCNQPIEVDDDFANQQAECPYCHRVITVPAESTLEPRHIAARPSGSETSEASDASRTAPPPPPTTGYQSPPGAYQSSQGGYQSTPPAYQPPPHEPGGLHVAHRDRPGDKAARILGNFALLSLLLFAVLAGYGAFTMMDILVEEGMVAAQEMTAEEQTELQRRAQDRMAEEPLVGIAIWVAMFFWLIGAGLAIASLIKSSMREWRAWLAGALTVVLPICICLGVFFQVAGSAAQALQTAPAP